MATFTKPSRPLTWLITGASSGFGLSLSRLVLAKGHTLIATSRNPSRTPDLVAEVEGHGNGSKWLKLDVDDVKASSALVESVESSGQGIDVLVNNAGYCIYGPVETLTDQEVRAMMDTLCFGPLGLIRSVLPHMRKRRYGVIANFSSGATLVARDSMGPYAGAKAALDGMSRVLANEVAPYNVRVLTVTLGTYNTGFGNATILGKAPLPDDYKGSVADQMMQFMGGGKFQGNGDKDKAMKAVYDVVVGEGPGKGNEAERLLPLGTDISPRVTAVRDYLGHALDVFGEVCDSMAVKK
ncbi:putative short-chain oxidoreductase [Hypoxylon sp. FL1284]|nr:putative short-chain oxidoreductase [Hypoxylon sp. FL1284]